jgi:inosose dehydratase
MQHPRPPQVSRRQFIRAAVAAAGGVACANLPATEAPKNTLVGSNIYGWGQYAQRENRKLDTSEVMASLRDCGYDYLESNLEVSRPEENGQFAEQLKARGLQPVSLYTGGRFHESGKAEETVARIVAAAKVCQQAGFSVLSCNPDPIGREKTEEELKVQAAALSSLGRELKAFGMALGIHHHMPEMANKAREFHYDFEHSKPDEVGFCYDVHWVWKGGVAPADALAKYGNRVVTWHLRQSRDRIWWEDLDTGDIDFSAVSAVAKARRLPRRFTVELALEQETKVTRSVVENHRRSREFVRRVFES